MSLKNKVLNLFVLGFLLVGLILPAVSAANLAPIIGAVSDKAVKVGETLEFTIVVKDPEGDQIVSLVNAGKSLQGVAITKVTNNQYKFSWTPVAGQEGSSEFGLRATDAQGASSATEYFTVTVAAGDVPPPVNQAPVISPIADKQAKVGETLEFTIAVKDAEGDQIVSLINAGKLPEGVAITKVINNQYKFSWTPVVGQEGSHEFGLRATDAQGASSATEYFTVVVAAGDVPPPVPPTCESITDKDSLILQEGEEKCYAFNSVEYKIQLTFVDEDEAKFKVNGADTAKLKINAEETFADAKAKIKVKDILYQAYAGGIHSATFTLTAVASQPPLADKDKDGIADGLDNCPDNANVDQKDTDGDKLGDVCDNGTTIPPPTPTNTAKTDYEALKDKFDGYEDDFSYYNKKYEKAVKEEDKSDIKKYEKKLKELDDNLDDVEDDVNDLTDDLEDDEDKNENVLDDLDELEDDITALKEKINDALNGTTDETEGSTADYVVPTTAEPKGDAVEVTTYTDLSGVTGAATVEPAVKEINWSQVRYTALLIAGIVVLLAVVLFLLAVLFR